MANVAAMLGEMKMQNKQGFTLIEILMALAVIAIAITALLKNSAQSDPRKCSFTRKIN